MRLRIQAAVMRLIMPFALACTVYGPAQAQSDEVRLSYSAIITCNGAPHRLIVGFRGASAGALDGIAILEHRNMDTYSSRFTTRGSLNNERVLRMQPVSWTYRTRNARQFPVSGQVAADFRLLTVDFQHPGCPRRIELPIIESVGIDRAQSVAWLNGGAGDNAGRVAATPSNGEPTGSAPRNPSPSGARDSSAGGAGASGALSGQPIDVPVRQAIGRELANFAGQFAGLSVAAMRANGSYVMIESMAWLAGNTGQGIGSGEIDMMVEVDEARCVSRPPPAGASRAALCRYKVRTRGMQRMYFPVAGQDFIVESLDSGWATRTDLFVESGGAWRSPDVAQSMVNSLARRQVSRTPNSDPNAGLCRALGAGVIATGGASDSQRMYSSAGC